MFFLAFRLCKNLLETKFPNDPETNLLESESHQENNHGELQH